METIKNISNRSYIDRLLATHLSNIIYLPKHIHLVFTPEEKIAIIKISNSVNNIIKSNHFEPHRSSASTLKSSVKRLENLIRIKSKVMSFMKYF